MDDQQVKVLNNDNVIFSNIDLNNLIDRKLSSYEMKEEFVKTLHNGGYKGLKEKFGFSRDMSKKVIRKLYNEYEKSIPDGFKEVSGNNNYIVNDRGDIRQKRTRRKLNYNINYKGYYTCDINRRKQLVHRLVAQTFIENSDPNKNVINHKDGNKKNNNIDNLEWVTIAENNKHARLNGLVKPLKYYGIDYSGENNNSAKLTKENVLEIRERLHLSNSTLAKEFNVSISTISGIRNGRTWKDI